MNKVISRQMKPLSKGTQIVQFKKTKQNPQVNIQLNSLLWKALSSIRKEMERGGREQNTHELHR